jgi:hypothetical protein
MGASPGSPGEALFYSDAVPFGALWRQTALSSLPKDVHIFG